MKPFFITTRIFILVNTFICLYGFYVTDFQFASELKKSHSDAFQTSEFGRTTNEFSKYIRIYREGY